jgi:hypothetical protein
VVYFCAGDAGQGELLLQEMVVAGTWYIERQNAVALPKGKKSEVKLPSRFWLDTYQIVSEAAKRKIL